MKYVIPISVILLFFSSCAENSKNDLAVFRGTTNSLEQSSKTISEITTDYRRRLFESLNDARTAEHAAVWHPRATKISEQASSTIQYIDTLKSQLIRKSDNFQIVNKVFFQQEKGVELYRQLRNFIDTIYTVDPRLNNRYDELIKEKFDYLDSAKYHDKEFTKTFFNRVSIAAALSLLAKFENDIRNIEKETVAYCYYSSLPGCNLNGEAFQVIIGLSSSCVKAGDEIELNAGVGAFSTAAQPNFTVDGKFIPPNENGIAAYKFKTSSKAGNYSKVVKIEYTKPDGTKETIIKNIEYTVINPTQNPQ